MLEFIYTGSTTIENNEETLFSHLLTNFEIGGSGSIRIVENKFLNLPADEELFSPDIAVSPEVDTIKKFECKKCGQVLKTRTGYRQHMETHEPSKAFTCERCGKGIHINFIFILFKVITLHFMM